MPARAVGSRVRSQRPAGPSAPARAPAHAKAASVPLPPQHGEPRQGTTQPAGCQLGTRPLRSTACSSCHRWAGGFGRQPSPQGQRHGERPQLPKTRPSLGELSTEGPEAERVGHRRTSQGHRQPATGPTASSTAGQQLGTHLPDSPAGKQLPREASPPHPSDTDVRAAPGRSRRATAGSECWTHRGLPNEGYNCRTAVQRQLECTGDDN